MFIVWQISPLQIPTVEHFTAFLHVHLHLTNGACLEDTTCALMPIPCWQENPKRSMRVMVCLPGWLETNKIKQMFKQSIYLRIYLYAIVCLNKMLHAMLWSFISDLQEKQWASCWWQSHPAPSVTKTRWEVPLKILDPIFAFTLRYNSSRSMPPNLSKAGGHNQKTKGGSFSWKPVHRTNLPRKYPSAWGKKK